VRNFKAQVVLNHIMLFLQAMTLLLFPWHLQQQKLNLKKYHSKFTYEREIIVGISLLSTNLDFSLCQIDFFSFVMQLKHEIFSVVLSSLASYMHW
jgi:hypothetical protein